MLTRITTIFVRLLLCSGLLLLGLVIIPASVTPAYAATITVTTNADSGPGSLRQAIADAASGDTITFSGDMTITPYIYELVIDKSLTIDGQTHQIIISGNSAGRAFNVTAGTVTFNRLTVIDGLGGDPDGSGGGILIQSGGIANVTNSTFSGNSAVFGSGGGIANFGTLYVTNSIFSGNSATTGGDIANLGTLYVTNSIFSGSGIPTYQGGGINNGGSLTVTNSIFSGNSVLESGGGIRNVGSLNVTNSTFSGNSASGGSGGGIFNSGWLNVTNSTFTGNSANTSGGGIDNHSRLDVTNSTFSGNSALASGGGISNDNTLTVQNSTFSSNTANTPTDSYGGGIYNGQTLSVQNSTFSGNSAFQGGGIYNLGGTLNLLNTLIANSPSGGDCRIGGGSLATNDHNLIQSDVDACGLTNGMGGSLIGVDPRLASLGHYGGGGIQTFALLPDSPAIDAGNACLTTDQRGQARDDLRCDIGAYELKYPDSPTVSRSVNGAIGTTFGPALVGIQRDAGFTDPGVITVTKGTWSPQGPESIGAQWTITPTTTSGFSLTLQLCYTAAELGGLTESNLRFYRSDVITYTRLITAPVLSTLNGYHCAALSGINQLSRWTLATDVPTAITLNELSARASGDAASSLAFALLLMMVLLIGRVAWVRGQTYQR